MMRMSAPVVTLATEPRATPPEAERESVLWRADSLTHTFPGISYSQVIYDAYIALGERREPLYPYAILYPRRPLFPDAWASALETFQDGERRRALLVLDSGREAARLSYSFLFPPIHTYPKDSHAIFTYT